MYVLRDVLKSQPAINTFVYKCRSMGLEPQKEIRPTPTGGKKSVFVFDGAFIRRVRNTYEDGYKTGGDFEWYLSLVEDYLKEKENG